MRIITSALLLACLGAAPAFAQEDVTTDAAGAGSAKLTINPAAPMSAMPQSATILTGLYATMATAELCDITVPDVVNSAMSAHRKQMETGLSMDAATATKAYDTVRGDVEKAGVDCAENSTDRQQAQAVFALYQQAEQPAAAPAATGAPAAVPAPAAQ